MDRVLVVDQNCMPINDISLQRAIRLLFREYRDETGRSKPVAGPIYNPKLSPESQSFIVRVANGAPLLVPKVIQLLKKIRSVYKTGVPYSKKNVLLRDKDTCAYCGSRRDLTVDHVVPLSRGGADDWDNTVAACFSCNNKKGNKLPSEAGLHISRKPYQPTVSEFLHIRLKANGLADILTEIFTS